jgi:NADH:ubiquinone oxidoreductase subunit 2 (subunit N)
MRSRNILMGINMLGAIVIVMSKELFTLYLGLEIYSFTTYILITPKEKKELMTPEISKGVRKINIQYLFYNSFSSALLLLGIYFLYKDTGGFGVIPMEFKEKEIVKYFFIVSILFKLGSIPYTYWIMRVYPVIEKQILLIQLIVSKYVYLVLLIKLEEILTPKGIFLELGINSKSFIVNTLIIVGVLTILYGVYKGVGEKTYKGIIASSSILTLGLILISLGNK